MKSDYPFPDKCEKCIHVDVCYMVGECLNHIPGFKCDCFGEKRTHGAWIEKTGMRVPEDKGVKFCSNCMNRQPRDFITHKPIEPDFCPNCGSDNRKRN